MQTSVTFDQESVSSTSLATQNYQTQQNGTRYFDLVKQQKSESEGDFPETSRTGDFGGLKGTTTGSVDNEEILDPIVSQNAISLNTKQ